LPFVHPPDSITLRALRFHARVGVLPHERELAQPLEIDLTVWLSRSDDVLDYRALYADAAAAVADEPLHYIEHLAEGVVRRALAHGRVLRARAAVRKPHVALPGPLAYAEVVVEREAERRADG
jgi:7,8-dihydroneopterin aldolase/epimerase/oxygenase